MYKEQEQGKREISMGKVLNKDFIQVGGKDFTHKHRKKDTE